MQLNVRDACRIFRVPENTLNRWIEEESLPAHRINDQYRFSRAELLEWATTRKIDVSGEIYDEPAASAPGLSAALEAGGIIHGIAGLDAGSILRAIVEGTPFPEGADRPLLLQMLQARATLGSTAVGEGVAIPHVRSPIVLRIPKPIMTVGFLANPVDLGAPDGKPVRALFSLFSPTVRVHLHLLSRLAQALRDPGFMAVVARQGSRAEILSEARRLEAGPRGG